MSQDYSEFTLKDLSSGSLVAIEQTVQTSRDMGASREVIEYGNGLRVSTNKILVDDEFAMAGLTTDNDILMRYAGTTLLTSCNSEMSELSLEKSSSGVSAN